jgi:hypothetical protein
VPEHAVERLLTRVAGRSDDGCRAHWAYYAHMMRSMQPAYLVLEDGSVWVPETRPWP